MSSSPGSRASEIEHDRSFDDFYRSEFAGLVALATAVLGRRSGADDLVQDAMVEAYRRWDRLGGYESPRAWVRMVVVQRSTKLAKKRSNERAAQLRAVARRAPEPAAPPELDPSLRAHLEALPPRQRAVLALHYLDDCSVSEIAVLLRLSEGTVKTHLSRGRRRLAGVIDTSDQEDRS